MESRCAGIKRSTEMVLVPLLSFIVKMFGSSFDIMVRSLVRRLQ